VIYLFSSKPYRLAAGAKVSVMILPNVPEPCFLRALEGTPDGLSVMQVRIGNQNMLVCGDQPCPMRLFDGRVIIGLVLPGHHVEVDVVNTSGSQADVLVHGAFVTQKHSVEWAERS